MGFKANEDKFGNVSSMRINVNRVVITGCIMCLSSTVAMFLPNITTATAMAGVGAGIIIGALTAKWGQATVEAKSPVVEVTTIEPAK